MSELCKNIVESRAFQPFIIVVILIAAVLVGMETYPAMRERHGETISVLSTIVIWVFAVEATLKMAQHGRRFYVYFQDPWNVFDFLIVVVCFLPLDASYAAVLRLIRVLRVMRLMTALPQLQLIVGALIKSIPSMGYVGVLLVLNFYVYAVLGVFLFGQNDPIHFHDLPTGMLSLFRIVTLEDWTDIMYINMFGSDDYPGPDLAAYQAANNTGLTPDPGTLPGPLIGALYFVTFVLFGTMIMLNLFIGVILNSMDESRGERVLQEEERRHGAEPTPHDQLVALEGQVEDLKEHIVALRLRVK